MIQNTSRRWLWLVLLAGLVAIGADTSTTWAHPLGNFTVNRYSRLEVGIQQLHVYYVLDMAEIPAVQERGRIDINSDGTIDTSEHQHYLAHQTTALQRNLHLAIDGQALRLEPHEHQLAFPEGQGGLPTLRLTARFVADVPAGEAPWQVEYRDDNYAERLGWQEIVVQADTGTQVLASTVPDHDMSQELQEYPQDLLQSPLAVSSARFSFQPGVTSSKSLTAAPQTQPDTADSADRFAALVTTEQLGPATLLLTLLAAFTLGAMHALSPGHGKTVVAAYLVGSRGTIRHALFLGLTTTITHTAGVFALGLVTLLVSEFILPEQLYPWLGAASGVMVCAIGFTLFRERLRGLRRSATHAHHHHHDHHHDHHHHHHHHHWPFSGHGHEHSHLPPGADGSPVTWRSLLVLGISGGLLPCPSALVVLLSAIALQRIGFGLLLIVAFSLGLASVLTAIGIAIVHAGHWFHRIPTSSSLLGVLPVISALVVTLAGLAIMVQALGQI